MGYQQTITVEFRHPNKDILDELRAVFDLWNAGEYGETDLCSDVQGKFLEVHSEGNIAYEDNGILPFSDISKAEPILVRLSAGFDAKLIEREAPYTPYLEYSLDLVKLTKAIPGLRVKLWYEGETYTDAHILEVTDCKIIRKQELQYVDVPARRSPRSRPR